MMYHIFVLITETQEKLENLSKINYGTCVFERLKFYSNSLFPKRFDTEQFRIFKEPKGFQETLPVSPLNWHSKHVIKLKGSITKKSLIYKLTPAEDDVLRAQLADALEKGIIRASNSPYGAAVVFVAKKDEAKPCH